MSVNAYEVQMIGGPLDGHLIAVPIFDFDPTDNSWPQIETHVPQVVGDVPADLEVQVLPVLYKIEVNPADDGALFIARPAS